MIEKAKTAILAVFLGVPLVFHILFRSCGRWAYGCRRSLLGWILVEIGGPWGELVRSTEYLFTGVIVVLFVIALLGSTRDRLPF
ncbi:hypothetical protein [Halobellus rarus]|uniref:Uncharacterized protein n=1 Tax=Halobellus rarus TaxID=1126237 RepID=A0ABD6CTC3_9EURY|nr:hypothetical protein [Halobellus rarus]